MIWPECKTDRHEAQGGTRFFADVGYYGVLPQVTPRPLPIYEYYTECSRTSRAIMVIGR